jgi:5-deoxy-glucuronate isomerase
MAPPGYDMYYLNVMAGPGQTRAWLICDDPAHAWVRQTWDGQPVDPRLARTEREREELTWP